MTDRMSLANVCEGKANDLFETELMKVLENVADESTTADTRKIMLEFEIKPDNSREQVLISCNSKVKLAGSKSCQQLGILQREGDKFVIKPQPELFPPNENHREIEGVKVQR